MSIVTKFNIVGLREKIPTEIQEDCDEIYPAVLVNTVNGRRAYNLKNSGDITTRFLIQAFGPRSRDQNGKYSILFCLNHKIQMHY